MRNKIVALVGMPGSGKTEAGKFFKNMGFRSIRFGQIVLDEAIKLGQVNEEIERKIRNGFREKYGMGAMAILNIPKIDELFKKGNVVIDGLYSWDEYKILKNKYGEEGIKIVAVIASPITRYARLGKRFFNKEKDPRAIYRQTTIKEAKTRDYDQIEKADQGGPIAMADFYIINEGSPISFQNKLIKLFTSIL